MKIIIEGKNIELTQALKDYVNEKLTRLEHHYAQIIKGHDIKVNLSVAKNPRITDSNITEVTIFLNGRIIRSEHASNDMYASIDLVTDKLNRQIEKYKAKVYRSYHHNDKHLPNNITSPTDVFNEIENHKPVKDGKIIKSKKFLLHPMTPEDATVHLDLINHDFYVFINSGTSQINILYKRKDGDYGLIEPQTI